MLGTTLAIPALAALGRTHSIPPPSFAAHEELRDPNLSSPLVALEGENCGLVGKEVGVCDVGLCCDSQVNTSALIHIFYGPPTNKSAANQLTSLFAELKV